MPELNRSRQAPSGLCPSDQSQPYLQSSECPRSHFRRRTAGLYRAGARSGQRVLPGLDGKERLGRLMADLLLELLSEEIPARMQAKARADLARLFAERVAEAGLQIGAIETFSTPRRLALIARD